MITSITLTLILILVFIGIVALSSLYFARPIVLAQLFDAWDLILAKANSFSPDPSIVTREGLDAFIAEQLAKGNAPGAAVAVVANGEVAWSKGYGFANIKMQTPVTADTPFGLGSVSKTIIAVALMQAIEDGQLTLDTAINDVLPFQVNNPRITDSSITLRHLATHTSGIKERAWTYHRHFYEQGDPSIELGEFLRAYLTAGGKWYSQRGNFLAKRPGEEYEYSNIASALAAYVIEEAVGQPFDQFTRERIFGPLNMKNTGWFLTDFDGDTPIAMPYTRLNRPYGYLGLASWPDGQLRSSANDLGRFLAAIMNGGLLSGTRILEISSVRRMLESQFPNLEMDNDDEQGIFWAHEKNLVGHTGGDPGVFAFMFFDPNRELGAIVLTNSFKKKSARAAANILRQILRSDGTTAIFGTKDMAS